ncbi:MAG: M15 family metallopeptidase [Oscillospiraceae bacterium]|nr:M15 family metallopeptidase [Oscillospiraceae bacterium]
MDIFSQENSQPEESDGSEGFVLVTDVIPEVILEIRYFSTYNFVGERIDGYEQPCALLTKEAAQALKAVNDDLMEQGYRLKIFDAYRPKMAVEHFVRWAEDLNAEEMKPYFYPDVEKSRLFQDGYISSKSDHSRGSTVDLTLFDDKTGKEVDMGSPFDYFGAISHSKHTSGLTEEQIANRKLLRDVMVKHGFRPISTEWWHFRLIEEPYPDTYFNFPVSADSVK